MRGATHLLCAAEHDATVRIARPSGLPLRKDSSSLTMRTSNGAGVQWRDMAGSFLHALDQQSDSLANSNTHGAQCASATRGLQRAQRSNDESCATRAERVSKCNSATIWIDMSGVVWKT